MRSDIEGRDELVGTEARGVDERRRRLARYMTGTPDDLAELNEALAAQRIIDEGQWEELSPGEKRSLR